MVTVRLRYLAVSEVRSTNREDTSTLLRESLRDEKKKPIWTMLQQTVTITAAFNTHVFMTAATV